MSENVSDNLLGPFNPAIPESKPESNPSQGEGKRTPLLKQFANILVSPLKAMNDINQKPSWLVPLLVSIALSTGFMLYLNWKLDAGWQEITRKTVMERAEKMGNDPQATPDVAVYTQTAKGLAVLSVVVTRPLLILLLAIVFAAGMVLMGAEITFKKLVSVITWSSLAPQAIYIIVAMLSLTVASPERLKDVYPGNLSSTMITNLSVVLDKDSSQAAQAICSSFDVFTIWLLVLLTMGLAAIAGTKRITRTHTGVLVFGFWAIWIVLKTVYVVVIK